MKKVSWIVLLIMSSCSPEESTPSPAPPKTKPPITWSTFTILPGEHNCEESTLMTTLSDTLEFRAVFDSSALYISQDPVNQKDWNKLFGFSDCSSFHQTNSFRLGWRHTENLGIEIGAYYYVNGTRLYESVDTIQPLDTLYAQIAKVDSTYHLTSRGRLRSYPRGCSGTHSMSYYLFPYFGGDEPAQDTVTINMSFTTPNNLFP